MVRILIVLLLTSSVALGQYVGPTDRGILDLLYLNEGEQIHGSNIIDGTLTSEKIADGAISNNHINAAAEIDPTKISGEALTKITVFGGDATGTWDNLVVTNVPAGLTTGTVYSGVVTGLYNDLQFTDNQVIVSNVAVTDVVFTAVDDRPHQEGLVYYDADEFALTYFNEEADVGMAIGRELWTRVRNRTGATITNGYMVYVDGAQGNLPTISLASALDHANSMSLLGMATHDIEDNSIGYVTVLGDVKDLDTSAWTNGTVLYLSEVDGEKTNAPPDKPAHPVRVGVVANSHITQGIINLKVGEAQELDALTVHDGDFLGISATNARITLSGGQIDFDGGEVAMNSNMYFLTTNTDLETFFNSTVATGGVVYLAAGEYWPSNTVSINKSMSIIGAGVGLTTIKLTNDFAAAALQPLVSDVLISDLSIDMQAEALSLGVNASGTASDVITNIGIRNVSISCNGGTNSFVYGIRFIDADGFVEHCTIDCVATNSGAWGINHRNNSTAEKDTKMVVRDGDVRVNSSGNSFGLICSDITASQTALMDVYNSYIFATNGNAYAVVTDNNDALMNLSGCILEGSTRDASDGGSGVNVRNCVFMNGVEFSNVVSRGASTLDWFYYETGFGTNDPQARIHGVTTGSVDILNLSSGSVEMVTVTSDGYMGVGTNDPAELFHIDGVGLVEHDATNGTEIVNYRTLTNEVLSDVATSKGELAVTANSPTSQALTAGGAFEIITNFTINVDRGDVDVTTTNIATGGGVKDWEFLMTGSGEKTSGASSELDLHIFTNGVDSGFGITRSISATGSEGSWGAHGTFLSLPDGTDTDVRGEVSVSTTILFEHLVYTLKEDR